MRVTLVTSPFFDHGAYYSEAGPAAQAYLPLGLLALAARLREESIDVAIADLNVAYNRRVWWNGDRFYETGAEFIASFGGDIVGFLTAYDSYHHILGIAGELKARMPGTPVVLGGYQASVVAEETIAAFPCVDAVVRGEGEEALLKVIRCWAEGRDLAGIPGTTFRQKGQAVRNADHPLIPNLDALPVPAYDLYPIDPRRFVYLEVGRGCPFQCTYCSTSPFWKRMTRYKSPTRVVDEMRLLQERHSVAQFHFVHDLFTVNNQWVLDFCETVKAAGIAARWTCSGSINTVDEALVEAMAAAGCAGIYFGIETGSEEIAKKIRKQLDLTHAENVIRRALELGVAPVTGFIAGFPFETEETLERTLSTFFRYKRLGVPLAHMFVAIPEKGSPLYQEYAADLEPTRHFLDFPLSPRLAERNFELIERHHEIFCGMYRFRNPHFGSDFFRGIDEFSPLVNTVPVPVNLAVDALGDPLSFYRGWMEWISRRNDEREKPELNRFYGSTQDMLDYVAHLQETAAIDIPFLAAVLRYESAKNAFRYNLGAIEQSLQAMEPFDGSLVDEMSARPVHSPYDTVVMLDWDIQPVYAGSREASERTTFILIYVSLRQRAGIGDFFKDVMLDISAIKIDAVTKAILEMSDGETTVEDIVLAIGSFAESASDMASERARDMVIDRIDQLQAIGVLDVAATAAAVGREERS